MRKRSRPLVFISYRGSDTGDWAPIVEEKLGKARRIGDVFLDEEGLRPADEWLLRLKDEINRSDCVLVLVGTGWATARSEDGATLADPEDVHRKEIVWALAAAAAGKTKLLPVLVGGARLPHSNDVDEAVRGLLDAQAARVNVATRRKDLRRLVRTIREVTQLETSQPRPFWLRARFLALVAALLIVVGFVGWYTLIKLPVLPEDKFNIAVAQFDEVDGAGELQKTDRGLMIASDVATQLAEDLKVVDANVEVRVAPPSETGAFRSTTAEGRAALAQKLSEDRNIDILIYGVLDRRNGQLRLTPELHVSNRDGLFEEAAELVGSYNVDAADAGFSDSSGKNLTQDLLFKNALASRVKEIAEAVAGIGLYRGGRDALNVQLLVSAEAAFSVALGPGENMCADGGEWQATLYLLRANAEAVRGTVGADSEALSSARDDYEKALCSFPDYGRALLGLAELSFQELRSVACLPGSLDSQTIEDLRDDARLYIAATTASNAPDFSFVPAKGNLGAGRVLFCISRATEDEAQSLIDGKVATVHLDEVLALHAERRASDRLAATATGFRGHIARFGLDGPADPGLAVARYEEAAKLHPVPVDRALWYTLAGCLSLEIGKDSEGKSLLQESLDTPGQSQPFEDVEKFAEASCLLAEA